MGRFRLGFPERNFTGGLLGPRRSIGPGFAAIATCRRFAEERCTVRRERWGIGRFVLFHIALDSSPPCHNLDLSRWISLRVRGVLSP